MHCKGEHTLKVLRTIFEEGSTQTRDGETNRRRGRMILVLKIENESELHTTGICRLAKKMEAALPGILPQTDDAYAHVCGAGSTRHGFREEIEKGTTVPHLIEHLILHMLGRSNSGCSGFSGQRSIDLARGIGDHYYVVTDYADKLQALVVADLAIQLVSAWMAGRTVKLEAGALLDAIEGRLKAVLPPAEASRDQDTT
ncbi:MAG TPA: hypothetical protein VMX94_09455 [Armatimonadota bacterium]|nr:hypothetical protein [Armatimonadota bacterium]